MPEFETQLKRIQQKMQQVLKDYTVLQKEKIHLKKELDKSREQARLQLQTIDSLRQQAEILKMNAGELSEPDKKEIEKRINSYIKEIDRCIALLGE
jgi:chromosome segregation ATPase